RTRHTRFSREWSSDVCASDLRINNTFRRADQIQWAAGIEPNDPRFIDYFLPIVADAEAGFGGVLNAFELMKSMIEAGAAAVTFEMGRASCRASMMVRSGARLC